MQNQESYDWLRLLWTPGLDFEMTRLLLEKLGLPEEILAAGFRQLNQYVPQEVAIALSRPANANLHERIEKTLHWLNSHPDARLVTLIDPSYPRSMLQSGAPVIAFFAWGDMTLLEQPSIAFIGASQLSSTGLDITRQWSVDLSARSLSVVAGPRQGAQRESLRAIAQYARGRMIYLPTHCLSADEDAQAIGYMAKHGLVLSLLGPYEDYPDVNEQGLSQSRMMLALCQGFIVVEAALSAPAMKLAKEALDLHRTVMAIPGSIYSPLSKGPHKLIKEGAFLVETTLEVLAEMKSWRQ